MTDEVMFEIRELTGQPYVNVYGGADAETSAEVRTDARPVHVGEVLDRAGESAATDHGVLVGAARDHGQRRRNRRGSRRGDFVYWADDVHDLDLAPRWFGPGVPARHHRGRPRRGHRQRLKKAAVAATVDGNEVDLPALHDGDVVAIITTTPTPVGTSCATRRRT